MCWLHADETVAVFSHSDVMKAAPTLGLPLDLLPRIIGGHASVSALRRDRGNACKFAPLPSQRLRTELRARRLRRYSVTIGSTEITTMATMTMWKFRFTVGIWPNQ